jgi:hypothetical protein
MILASAVIDVDEISPLGSFAQAKTDDIRLILAQGDAMYFKIRLHF